MNKVILWVSISIALIVAVSIFAYRFIPKNSTIGNYQTNNKTMISSNIKIVPGPLTNKTWKLGSTQTISWGIANVPKGKYVTVIDLVDTQTKLSVGNIPHTVNETVDGDYKIDYVVSTILIGGDAIQPLNPGKYQLRYRILELEFDNGNSADPYRPRYSPGYFFEVASESFGGEVSVEK